MVTNSVKTFKMVYIKRKKKKNLKRILLGFLSVPYHGCPPHGIIRLRLNAQPYFFLFFLLEQWVRSSSF